MAVRHRLLKRLAIGTALLAPIVAVGSAAVVEGRAKEEPTAVLAPVVRTILVVASAQDRSRFTGVVHARYESALGFRVGGKIRERLVDPGDRVRTGQALMRLDETDFVLARQAAHEAVAAAQATATQAASDERRRRALVGQGWVTAQAYEQNKALADASSAQLRSALSRESQAADQAGYAVLRADADGVVMETPDDPGQVVAEGQTVVRLAHDGPREAEIYLPEGKEPRARDPATATLYIAPGALIPAKLRELSAIADPLTRTYRARYVLGGDGGGAPLGATVTIRFEASGDAGRNVAVPATSVFDEGRGPQVWVVDAATSTVAPRSVRIVSLGEEDAVVTGDLPVGARVVALGVHLLKAGERIAVETPPIDTAGR